MAAVAPVVLKTGDVGDILGDIFGDIFGGGGGGRSSGGLVPNAVLIGLRNGVNARRSGAGYHKRNKFNH